MSLIIGVLCCRGENSILCIGDCVILDKRRTVKKNSQFILFITVLSLVCPNYKSNKILFVTNKIKIGITENPTNGAALLHIA